MKVAVIAGEVPVHARAGVRCAEEAFAIEKHRALKTVAINPLGVIEVRRLMKAEAHPRAARRPIIEIELTVRVFEAKGQAAVKRAARAGLADDIRRDAKREVMIEISGQIDVCAADVERR